MIDMDHGLSVLGALVTLCSSLASVVNHVVRTRRAAGKPVAQALLGTGAALNVGAVNLDKAIELLKILRSLRAPAPPSPEAAPVAPAADEPQS